MRSVLKEPLFHFILLGALLFAGHALWERGVTKNHYTINVSTAELQRQAKIFASENRRQPSDEDIQALLFAYIEEQVLMREALRLGLDSDDTIIRRRLAQKMRFMIDDVAPPPAPTDVALQAWYDDNLAEFVQPEKRSLSHVYYSPQNRSDIEGDAEAGLKAVSDINWKTLGDPFIQTTVLRDQTQTSIRRDFGETFSACVFKLPDNIWTGPCPSAFGLHLVKITAVEPAFTPEFDAIKPEITRVWQAREKRNANQAQLAALLGKYKVNVEDTQE